MIMKSLSDIVNDACMMWEHPKHLHIKGHSCVGVTIAVVSMEEMRKRLMPIIHEQRRIIEKSKDEIKELCKCNEKMKEDIIKLEKFKQPLTKIKFSAKDLD